MRVSQKQKNFLVDVFYDTPHGRSLSSVPALCAYVVPLFFQTKFSLANQGELEITSEEATTIHNGFKLFLKEIFFEGDIFGFDSKGFVFYINHLAIKS